MTYSFSWRILYLSADPSNGFVVHVAARAKLLAASGFEIEFPVAASFTQTSEQFVPFENLTEDLVSNWLDGWLSDDKRRELEARANAFIASIPPANPYQDLPWASGSTEKTSA